MRGGSKGFKGFVFEELHAANQSSLGIATDVISNNGIADFMILNKDGTRSLGQAKMGYGTSKIDWSAYEGQQIIIDKGNTKLIESAKNAGLDVIESNISNKNATSIAKLMQSESKIRGIVNAPITSKMVSMHQAGLASAHKGGLFGAGFSLGGNFVDLMYGDKDLGEATINIAKDTTSAIATSYLLGAAASTSAGTAVTGAIGAAGAMVANTAIGGSVVAGASALSGTFAASAIGTSLTTGSTVIATSALGTAIATSAIGGAVIAAAPVVAGAAVIGGMFKLGKKLFGR